MTPWIVLASLLLAAGTVHPPAAPPVSVQAQPPPSESLVELPAGTTYNLNARGDEVRVPLALHDGIAISDLEPVLFDVALGKAHDTALLASFRPRLEPDGALLLAVALDPPLRQGSYDVRLRV